MGQEEPIGVDGQHAEQMRAGLQLFRDTVRRFVEDEMVPRAREFDAAAPGHGYGQVAVAGVVELAVGARKSDIGPELEARGVRPHSPTSGPIAELAPTTILRL